MGAAIRAQAAWEDAQKAIREADRAEAEAPNWCPWRAMAGLAAIGQCINGDAHDADHVVGRLGADGKARLAVPAAAFCRRRRRDPGQEPVLRQRPVGHGYV
jgi:hypothetical protein